MLKLFDYIRSSAAYRVRIALALKGLDTTKAEVHLVKDGGQQHTPEYKALNPQGLVPSLELENGTVLTQSLAIIEYLEEQCPSPALLPKGAEERALVRAMALSVAADIHPIQNLRVLNYLRKDLALPETTVTAWARHWIESGLGALEGLIARAPVKGPYCFGVRVTMADVCLAPQMVNARRFGCDVSALKRVSDVDAALRALPAFSQTSSEAQA